jgi:hypothetical protein
MADKKDAGGKKPLTSAEKRKRAKARKAEREARRREKEDTWKSQVAAHFGFLETTYGFHFAQVDGSDWWETSVRYDSPLLAIKIDKSAEFLRVELCLIRLVDGQMPEYPIFINPDTPIFYVFIGKVLEERAPREAEKLRKLTGISDEEVERSLAFLAQALPAYCDDVLRGDFSICDMIADKMHQQAREHPQGIRVILPNTSQPGDEAPLVETLQKDFPQQPIMVEYYSTQKRTRRRKSANGENVQRAGQPKPGDVSPPETP